MVRAIAWKKKSELKGMGKESSAEEDYAHDRLNEILEGKVRVKVKKKRRDIPTKLILYLKGWFCFAEESSNESYAQ